jgi:membrane protease YdiL (CAAX protease family)
MSWPSMVAALGVPLLCALAYVVWVPHGNGGRSVWFATKIWILGYPLFFFGLIGLGGLTRREDRPATWPSWKVVILTGALIGVGVALVGWLMVITPVGDIVKANSHNLVEKARGLGFATKGRFLMVAAFITLFHSAMEEYYWRWFVYGHLRQMVGHWPGHLVAALAFTGHHLVLTSVLFPLPVALFLSFIACLGGLMWTLMYEWQGTVLGCWISHLVVDAFLMIVGYRLIMGAGI